ncbi:MAG: hypothetical protein ACLUCY_20785 [Enterococcus avium]
MFMESIRYFNGENIIKHSISEEEVDYISYKDGKPVEVAFKDGTILKILSPYIEYKSKWVHDDSDEPESFGW